MAVDQNRGCPQTNGNEPLRPHPHHPSRSASHAHWEIGCDREYLERSLFQGMVYHPHICSFKVGSGRCARTSKRTSVPFRVSAPSNGYALLDQLLTETTGMTEAFAMEVSPFSIRVVLFEPSDMRSNFVSPSQLDLPDIPDVYKGTISDAVMKGFLDMHGKQRIDPVRAARLIVEEILRPCVEPSLLRIPLGREALELMGEKVRGLEEGTRALGDVGLGVDFPEGE